jgi:NADH-quinone oxidoreductase subunit G
VQVKGQEVVRVLPLENEAVNECWLSDRDRFSYEGLNSDDRLTMPMVNDGGTWREVDWPTALGRVVDGLKGVVAQHGGAALGTLVSPQATVEEMALAARLTRGLGSDNVDYRLRQVDVRGEGEGVRWLGMPVADIHAHDRILVVGSFLRNDQPLFAHRIRQTAKKRARVLKLSSVDDDWLMPVAAKAIVPPSLLPATLAEIVVAAAAATGKAVPPALASMAHAPGEAARAIGEDLAGGTKPAILLGSLAEQHPDAAQLHALAQALAELTGATLGFLREGANAVGGDLAGARPQAGGLPAHAMLAEPRRAYLVVHAEAEFDFASPVAARAAFERAEFVVVLSPWRTGAAYADVVLPIAPFAETSGTFVSGEGRVQSFRAVVTPRGQARPGWKVLRVLGTMLDLQGFDADSSEAVRDSVMPPDVVARLDNRTGTSVVAPTAHANGVERAADVPLYFSDPLVRRSPPLQQTKDARPPLARMHVSLLESLGIPEGGQVRIRQGRGEAVVKAVVDAGVPPGVVRLGAAHPSTCGLDGLTGPVSVERA